MCYALIKLNSVKDLHSFVDIMNKFPGNYEIIDGQFTLDAKSLMSMLSLNLSQPFRLILDSEQADEVLHSIQPFISHE